VINSNSFYEIMSSIRKDDIDNDEENQKHPLHQQESSNIDEEDQPITVKRVIIPAKSPVNVETDEEKQIILPIKIKPQPGDDKSCIHQVKEVVCSTTCRVSIMMLFNGILFILLCFIVTVYQTNFYHVQDTATQHSTATHTLNIVLYGDSLINIPYSYFNLGGLLTTHLDTFYHHFNIYNEAVNGQTIALMETRMEEVISYQPQAVIMQWDTDVSDMDLDAYGQDQDNFHQNYTTQVRQVVSQLQQIDGIEFIALSGPILLGESTYLPRPDFIGKNVILDAYRTLNQQICEEMNITYIDMRKIFQEALPKHWFYSRYYLTKDGEHPNQRGTKIIAKVFADTLKEKWLSTRSLTINGK